MLICHGFIFAFYFRFFYRIGSLGVLSYIYLRIFYCYVLFSVSFAHPRRRHPPRIASEPRGSAGERSRMGIHSQINAPPSPMGNYNNHFDSYQGAFAA
jgi:hypothetical protein